MFLNKSSNSIGNNYNPFWQFINQFWRSGEVANLKIWKPGHTIKYNIYKISIVYQISIVEESNK